MRSAIVIISRPCLLRELRQLGHARHRAVVVHDFADDAGRIAARRCAPDRRPPRCGRRAPARRPSRARSGNMWPGRARSRGRVAGSIAARTVARAVGRRDAGASCRPCASIDTQNAVSRRDELSRDLSGISSSSSRSGVIARQIRPRPCFDHEVDGLRRDLRRRHRQIAFVLAILVVDDDDHLAGANRLEGVLDRRERRPPAIAPLASCNVRVIGSSRAGPRPAAHAPLIEQPRHVLAQHVGLEVDAIARRARRAASCAPA